LEDRGVSFLAMDYSQPAARIRTGTPMQNGTHNSASFDRSSMDAMLDQGLSNRLTLLVGSIDDAAGAALAGWIERRSIAAVSVDKPDDEAANGCLQRVVEAFVGAGIISPDTIDIASSPNRTILVRLINELAALDRDIVLIFEGYAPSETSDCFLTFLLEHLPQQLHLYLFCEQPPTLSCIPRLRVRRQLQMIDTKAS
jgi:hypothetical protein